MPAKKTTKKESRKKTRTPKDAKAVSEEKSKETVIEPGPETVEVVVEETKTDEKGDRIEKYYEAIGRRKESTARVRVFTKKSSDIQPFESKGIIMVNGKPYFEYFNNELLQDIVDAPLKKLKSLNRFKATIKVNGGGQHGQADAIKFGFSRALVLFDPNFAKKLRKAGYLTRDSREKERRKYGLKKARKSPQWAKR